MISPKSDRDQPIRLVLVEDSATMRFVLQNLFRELGFEVVGTAASVAEAESLLAKATFDLVISDVRLPDGNGIELTRRLLQKRGLPILLMTAFDPDSRTVVFEALQAGALDLLAKPPAQKDESYPAYVKHLDRTIRSLARTPVLRRRATDKVAAKSISGQINLGAVGALVSSAAPIVALGASTGGPSLLPDLLGALKGRSIAFCVLAQHIVPEFSVGFATWVADISGRVTRQAMHGERAAGGVVYIAPQGRHFTVTEHGDFEIADPKFVKSNHVPSINFLFDGLSRFRPKETLGVLLTGMGNDGSEGLRALRHKGGSTIVQDPKTATISSMPAHAIEAGAAGQVLTPAEIADVFLALPKERSRTIA